MLAGIIWRADEAEAGGSAVVRGKGLEAGCAGRAFKIRLRLKALVQG